MSARNKISILVGLVMLQVAMFSLTRRDIDEPIMSMHQLLNSAERTGYQAGNLFPQMAVYDLHGHVEQIYRRGIPTLVIFMGCPCQEYRTNVWATVARRAGYHVVCVFPGPPSQVRSTVYSGSVEGQVAVCRIDELTSSLGLANELRRPLGYYLDGDGMVISEQT